MGKSIQPKKLFIASCLALLVESLSFGVRAGIMGDLMTQFQLSAKQMGLIAGTFFWGFPLAIIVGGMIIDIVGMKRLIIFAFFFHLMGIVFTILSNGFLGLYISTFCIGIASGTIEAVGNPLVTTIFPDNKTTRLNHFHSWIPWGVVIGTLISFIFVRIDLGWQWQMAVLLLPVLVYGYMFLNLEFPVTERVSSGISAKEMYKSLLKPLFIFMMVCMLFTSITEVFTNQWVSVLLKSVTQNSILLLTVIATIQAFGRNMAGFVVHRISLVKILIISSIISLIGIYLLSILQGNWIFLAAVIFGVGVTYFWPTMLGFVSENIPESGALGLNVLGGLGNFAASIYMIFMGGYYDNLILRNLPLGADIENYRLSLPGTKEATAFLKAEITAGPQILRATTLVPVFLIIAFILLNLFMRSKKSDSVII